MASSELIELRDRVRSLEQQLLPPKDDLGFYTDEQQDQMRALRMLIHAEIEAYLESICSRLLSDLDAAITAGTIFGPVVSVWANAAAAQCRTAIASNNGVKGTDIKQMFTPLGVAMGQYEAVSLVFLDRMTAFGKHRGDVAHQSALRATYTLNRDREAATINDLVGFLERFDDMVNEHRRRGFV